MLVFTRRRNEAITIGDGIEVHVLRVGRDGVRLGIVAPPEVGGGRPGLFNLIREANRSAAGTPPPMADVVEQLRRRG